MSRQLKVMIACGIAIVLLAGGWRQAFGVFLIPVTFELDVQRQFFGLVIASQALLFGLCQPAAGLLADRFGAFRIILAGALLYAAGLWLAGQSTSAAGLYASLGLLVGIGLSGSTQVVVLGAVGKAVPAAKRGTAFGLIIAAGSVGMFFMVPGAQALIDGGGWRQAFAIAAMAMLLVPLFALGLIGARTRDSDGPRQSLGAAIWEARTHSGYILLTLGFFVCGVHVTFVGTHLPAYLADEGVSAGVASLALGVIGLFNMVGAFLFGRLSDRYSKKNLLVVLYVGRAVVMALLLIVPMTDGSALVFGALMGVVWLATVPLTSGIVAQIFGTRYFGMLYGVVFMSHQFGAFAGAWLGGYIADVTGSYDLMWLISIALGLVAAALHWPIREQPVERMAPETA